MSTSKSQFIVLNGNASLQEKLSQVNLIDKSLGKGDWIKFLNKKPDVIPPTESVVILNDVRASLNFEFNVQGGIYDVIIRIIAPSGNSDSGHYIFDSMPEPVCWTLNQGGGAERYYIQSFYLLTDVALIPGIHSIYLFYREPMGLVDMTIKNKKTSEQLIMKAADVLKNNKPLTRMYKISKFSSCGTGNVATSKDYAYTLPTSSNIVVETPNPLAIPSVSSSSNALPSAFTEQTFAPANLAQTNPVIQLPPVLQQQSAPPSDATQSPAPIINVPQEEPNMAVVQAQTLPVVQPIQNAPPIVMPSVSPSPSREGRQLQAQQPSAPPTPLYVATGMFQQYESGSFYIVVFNGNGTIKFNKPIQVNIIAVAGGGGGAGGDSVVVDQFQRMRIIGANGGEGGANIMCAMNTQQGVQYDVVVGQKGLSGAAAAAGGNGGDTRLSVGTTNYIVCRGGAGGGTTFPQSSSYTANTTYISNIQAGSVAQNITGQGGKGGVGGYLDQRGGRGLGTVGQDSATFKVQFTNIPAELTNQISAYYGGGGGGGFCADPNSAGGAGNGQGGGKYDNAIGQSAFLYGAAGGGSIGSNPGGNGMDGIMIFFFPKSETSASTSFMSVATVTENQTIQSPVYMTTISPLPFLGMTVWLSASTMVGATTNTKWKNNAPNATSDAGNMGKLLSNAYNATIFNGQPGLNLSSGNAIFAVQMPAKNSQTGLTVLVVLRPVSTNNTYVGLVSRSTTKYPAPFDMYNNQRVIGDGSATRYKLATSSLNLKSLKLNTNYLFAFRIVVNANKTSTISEWLNGKPSTISPNNLSFYGDTSTYFYLGSRADKATLFSGYIGEVIYYNRPLSDPEVSNATTYLNSKYKIF
jgi:hypothetical protein